LIFNIEPKNGVSIYNCEKQKHGLENVLDKTIIKDCLKAINKKEKVNLNYKIFNTNRTVGAMLSGEIAQKYGHRGLPENTINIKFQGSAGQSFGAWLVNGVVMTLEGDANDYVGKGLSGGVIIIKPKKNSLLKAEENIIAGNTLLYGAINGECFLNGIVGERFAVRNSGATSVVEGCGDHGCEYMTGGITVILGKTGRNFAAGMSGGIAYVYDEEENFKERCNKSMVELKNLSNIQIERNVTSSEISNDLLSFDELRLKKIIKKHVQLTNSAKGKLIIQNWEKVISKFIKITPIEYKKALQNLKLNKVNQKIKIAGE